MIDYTEEYRAMHAKGKYFPGTSIKAYAGRIGELVSQHSAARLLDYGCGRGMQYLAERVHEQWDCGTTFMPVPHCYDIGIPALSRRPEGPFDGIICTDVMEHVPPDQVDAVLREFFELTPRGRGFIFLGIACRPARKTFSNGENLHLTIQPPSWWIDRIRAAAVKANRPYNEEFEEEDQLTNVVAHFDVSGHFDEPETPFDKFL